MVARVVAALATLLLLNGARITKNRKAGVLSTCGEKGASAPSGQIVNGEDATECEWRWQAQLRRNGRPFCGGSLIAPEWVLTAAHCVTSGANFDVVVGDYDKSTTSGNQQQRSAAAVFSHPDYAGRPTRNDYAVVRLSSPVTINDCVGTVCLPSAGNVAANTTCWITGWGTLSSGGSTPNILQEAPVNIVSNDDCVNVFGYTSSQIDDSMICAQGRLPDGSITDACQGDSGGPLVCESNGQWTLYGATSWGYGCAGANYPGVWARVSKEVDWIQDTMDGIFPTPAPAPPGGWYINGNGCEEAGACVQSLNHPSSYGNNQECEVVLGGDVSLSVEAFSTERGFDYLSVGGSRYSGTSGPSSGVYSGVISWESDFSVTNSGWKLCKA